MFTSKIGNGADTSLWSDYWLPNGGRISDHISARVISSTGLPWNAKVADIINNGVWKFPRGNQNLQQLWNTVTIQPREHEDDHIEWKGTTFGKFTIASAWNMVRKKKTTHHLHGLIWYPGNVPRYSLTLWLASLGRLSTMDRPHMGGIEGSRQCTLCATDEENHDHLFFYCPYTTTVWNNLTTLANIQWPRQSWANMLRWAGISFSKRQGFHNLLARNILATTTYFIWTERNRRIFQNKEKPAGTLSHEVITQIRLLLLNFKGHIPSNVRMRWNV